MAWKLWKWTLSVLGTRLDRDSTESEGLSLPFMFFLGWMFQGFFGGPPLYCCHYIHCHTRKWDLECCHWEKYQSQHQSWTSRHNHLSHMRQADPPQWNLGCRLMSLLCLLIHILYIIIIDNFLHVACQIHNENPKGRNIEGMPLSFPFSSEMTLLTVLAATVDTRMMLRVAPQPSHHSIAKGSSTVFWVAVMTWPMFMSPSHGSYILQTWRHQQKEQRWSPSRLHLSSGPWHSPWWYRYQ